MRNFSAWAVAACLCALPAAAQQDWTTIGNDAQRSAWMRSDPKISVQSVKAPDFQLAWRMKLDNEARGAYALSPPVLLDFLISHKGFRSLAFLAGSDGNVFTIDSDLSRMEWERRFGPALAYPDPTPDCPGGMTANLTRPTSPAIPFLAGVGSFGGRRSPGVSDVGEPGEGATLLKNRPQPTFRTPEEPDPNARVQPPPRRSLRGLTLVYALTPDGLVRQLLASNGYDYAQPIPFLPPNAYAVGLIAIDDAVLYVATLNGCGGAPNGVWALDLESHEVRSWKSGSASIAGTVGPAVAPDGTVYAATTDGRIVALEAMTLRQRAEHRAAGQSFVSSPVLIDLDNKDYLAVAAQDGAIHLLDASNLDAQPVAKTPGYSGASGFKPGALATWKDPSGTAWVLAPIAGAAPSNASLASNGSVSNGAVVAWKLAKKGDSYAFDGGWVSPDLRSPLPPIVINGVVFAAAGGDSSHPAVLHALDGRTGKPLWDSGSTATAPALTGGLTAGGGRVYLTTHDNTIYGFGFPIEH